MLVSSGKLSFIVIIESSQLTSKGKITKIRAKSQDFRTTFKQNLTFIFLSVRLHLLLSVHSETPCSDLDKLKHLFKLGKIIQSSLIIWSHCHRIKKVVQPRTHTHDDGKDTRFAKRSWHVMRFCIPRKYSTWSHEIVVISLKSLLLLSLAL